MCWAKCLYEAQVGQENPEYAYPESVLGYIRSLCPEDIVGEIRENAYETSMAEFCGALKLCEI